MDENVQLSVEELIPAVKAKLGELAWENMVLTAFIEKMRVAEAVRSHEEGSE